MIPRSERSRRRRGAARRALLAAGLAAAGALAAAPVAARAQAPNQARAAAADSAGGGDAGALQADATAVPLPASLPRPQPVSFATRDGTRLRAWLFVPTQAPGRPAGGPSPRLATVVALHGCSGVAGPHAPPGTTFSPRHLAMAEMLLGEGYAVLFPDSLGPRGTGSICSQKIGVRAVNQAQRRLDALAALSWVAAQPWADPHRIAVLGWSHGANTVLAVTNTKRPEVNAVPDRFAAAIAFYPWCRAAVQTGYRPNTHLAIMIGALDDWTPPQPCVSLGRITQSEVHVFGGTYHDFDNLAGRLRHIPNIPNGVDPAQGVHAGPNPDARDEAYSRVRRLLATALR